ncbi:MAG: RecX family transcriptional regulator [Prolixibacteraceae bacterium]|nr:RecX family transcriptional regulator [Prolixibacteraceae bacterium]
MDIFKKPLTYREAYAKATDLCSRSEKCVFDLELKCREWQLSAEESSKVIAILVRERFIDHERYATSFVNDKFRFNKWGKIKLAYALRQKHIEDKFIQKALSNLPEDAYHKILHDLLSAKAKTIRDNDGYARLGKLLAFAQSRGFEADLTLKLIDDRM